MTLRILAGFGTYLDEEEEPMSECFSNTAGENFMVQLARERYCVVRVTSFEQMLMELRISQPFSFDYERVAEEVHSEIYHSITPGNYFDWVFMDAHLRHNVTKCDSSHLMYALLYDEIMDGRIGFRAFTGNRLCEQLAGTFQIPCIRWTDAKSMYCLYDLLRKEANERISF